MVLLRKRIFWTFSPYYSSRRLLYAFERNSGHILMAGDSRLELGEYDIYCDGRCSFGESFNR